MELGWTKAWNISTSCLIIKHRTWMPIKWSGFNNAHLKDGRDLGNERLIARNISRKRKKTSRNLISKFWDSGLSITGGGFKEERYCFNLFLKEGEKREGKNRWCLLNHSGSRIKQQHERTRTVLILTEKERDWS
jgi:hypothetical protein